MSITNEFDMKYFKWRFDMSNEIEFKESMSEKEIVEYLKANKNKGVAFIFMPEEVKDWCKEHQDERIFMNLTSAGWDYNKRELNPLMKNAVYCLSDKYKPKPEFKPHFVEFDVDENGYFYYEGKEYYYRDDVAFEKRHSDIFKGFGGWLYECNNGPMWVTIPHIACEGNLYWYMMKLNEKRREITAPIPTKIRFWRYKE